MSTFVSRVGPPKTLGRQTTTSCKVSAHVLGPAGSRLADHPLLPTADRSAGPGCTLPSRSGPTRANPATPEYTRAYAGVPRHAQVCLGVPAYVRACSGTPGCTQACPGISGICRYTGVFLGIFGHTQVNPCTPGNAPDTRVCVQDIRRARPCEFIGLGAIDVTKLCKFRLQI